MHPIYLGHFENLGISLLLKANATSLGFPPNYLAHFICYEVVSLGNYLHMSLRAYLDTQRGRKRREEKGRGEGSSIFPPNLSNFGGVAFIKKGGILDLSLSLPSFPQICSQTKDIVTLRCMLALVRVQARVRAWHVRMSIEGQAMQQLIDEHRGKNEILKQAEVNYLMYYTRSYGSRLLLLKLLI